jgi:DNA-binding winged helix-turn-helix (wHTH) protein
VSAILSGEVFSASYADRFVVFHQHALRNEWWHTAGSMNLEPRRLSKLALELLTPVGVVGTTLILVDSTDAVQSIWATGVNRKMRRKCCPLTTDSPIPAMWAWREQTDLVIESRAELVARFESYDDIDAAVTAVAALLLQHLDHSVGVLALSIADQRSVPPVSRALFATVANLIGDLLRIPPVGLSTPMELTPATSDRPAEQVGALIVDEIGHDVRVDGHSIDLTRLEFELLLTLTRHRGQVLSKRQLLELIWGYEGYNDNVVEAQVSSLRRKLGPSGVVIETIRGYGYVIRRQSEIGGGMTAVLTSA